MTKKLITLLLALTMVFASAVPVMAVGINTPGYTSTSPTLESGEFYVKLNIQGCSIDDGNNITGPIQAINLNVKMGTENASSTYTVKDVLTNAASQHSDILDFNMVYTTNHGWYLSGIEDVNDEVWYNAKALKNPEINPNPTYFCGWMFRINGQIPMYNSTDGASLDQAYIKRNDIIDFYYANPYDPDYSTAFTQVIYDSATSKFQFLYSDLYIENGEEDWTIMPYAVAPYQNIYVSVDGGNYLYRYTDQNGQFSIANLSSGEHTIRVIVNWYNVFTDYEDSSIEYYVPAILSTFATVTI